MKNKILIFIIGVIVGALLATGGYYLYEQNTQSDESTTEQTEGQKPEGGEMPAGDGNGTMPEMNQDGNATPPELPDGENGVTPDAQSNETETNTTD